MCKAVGDGVITQTEVISIITQLGIKSKTFGLAQLFFTCWISGEFLEHFKLLFLTYLQHHYFPA